GDLVRCPPAPRDPGRPGAHPRPRRPLPDKPGIRGARPPAARVRLRLVSEPGEAVSDIFWKVRLANGPIVWSSTESEPVGLLQQGNYVIEVQTRQARHERSADVRAGADRVLIVGEN
ncbi:MAG: hypothetical protein J0J14_05675, partial [Hyphomicrobium sp.]|nr:hypothetical protein [Hyphomicrobium sp.]